MPSSLTQVLHRHQVAVAGFTDADLPSLAQTLARVADPRAARGVRYRFDQLLLVLTAAVVSGAKTLTSIAEWAHDAHTRGLIPGWTVSPSVATIHRIASMIDPEVYDEAISAWIRTRTPQHTNTGAQKLTGIAVDGKEIRGTKHGGGTKTHLLAAMCHTTGAVIAQESVAEKTNEIPHFPVLIQKLGPLAGAVITADAMHTLTQQAQAVTDAGGHYLFTVKINSKRLHTSISQAGWAHRKPQYTHREKAHGRISTWQITTMKAPKSVEFPHTAQIIRIHRGRRNIGEPADQSTGEFVYAITSLPPEQANPAELADLIRGHWGIENRLHWIRDTAYSEDTSQIRKGTTAHFMASLRNTAISLHRITGQTNITATLRHYGRHPHLATELIGL